MSTVHGITVRVIESKTLTRAVCFLARPEGPDVTVDITCDEANTLANDLISRGYDGGWDCH